MVLDVTVIVQRLQVAHQALLSTFEIKLVFFDRLAKALQPPRKPLSSLPGRHGITPVQVLDTANRGGRALGYVHHQDGNDEFAQFQRLGDLVQAITVRAAHRMRRHREHHAIAASQALLDALFPVKTAREALLVEPHLMAPLTQRVTQRSGFLDVLVTAVAEEEPQRANSRHRGAWEGVP